MRTVRPAGCWLCSQQSYRAGLWGNTSSQPFRRKGSALLKALFDPLPRVPVKFSSRCVWMTFVSDWEEKKAAAPERQSKSTESVSPSWIPNGSFCPEYLKMSAKVKLQKVTNEISWEEYSQAGPLVMFPKVSFDNSLTWNYQSAQLKWTRKVKVCPSCFCSSSYSFVFPSQVEKLLPVTPDRTGHLPSGASSVPHRYGVWHLIWLFQTFTLVQRRMSRKSRCFFFWILSYSFSLDNNIFLSFITLSAQRNDQLDVSCPSRDLMYLSAWSAVWTLFNV